MKLVEMTRIPVSNEVRVGLGDFFVLADGRRTGGIGSQDWVNAETAQPGSFVKKDGKYYVVDGEFMGQNVLDLILRAA